MVFRTNSLRKQDGFSLIELLMILVIIGIIASLTLPNTINIINRHKLDNTAKRIVSDMRYAQQLAISSESTYRIIFNNYESNPPNTYYLKDVKSNKTIKKVELPSDITIYLSKILLFKPNGTTENNTITLQNKNKETLFIVSYMWGRFRITRDQP